MLVSGTGMVIVSVGMLVVVGVVTVLGVVAGALLAQAQAQRERASARLIIKIAIFFIRYLLSFDCKNSISAKLRIRLEI
jgi:hypothetical protein